jgi:hypothetical protein
VRGRLRKAKETDQSRTAQILLALNSEYLITLREYRATIERMYPRGVTLSCAGYVMVDVVCARNENIT